MNAWGLGSGSRPKGRLLLTLMVCILVAAGAPGAATANGGGIVVPDQDASGAGQAEAGGSSGGSFDGSGPMGSGSTDTRSTGTADPAGGFALGDSPEGQADGYHIHGAVGDVNSPAEVWPGDEPAVGGLSRPGDGPAVDAPAADVPGAADDPGVVDDEAVSVLSPTLIRPLRELEELGELGELGPYTGWVDAAAAAEPWDLDVLDLSSAIRAAILHSPDVALARIQLIEAALSLKEEQVAGHPAVSVDLLEAEHAYHEAQQRFRASLVDAARRAEELFYNALRAQQLLELQKRRAEYTEAQLAIARVRHREGVLASIDLTSVELDYEQAHAELQEAVRSHAVALGALSALTGIEPLPPLAWTEDDLAYAPVETSLSQVLDHVRSAHLEVTGAEIALERARRRLEHDRITGVPPVQRARSELAVERARIHLAQTVQRVEEEARQLWDDVQRAEATLLLREKRLALARQRLQLTQTRHNAGAASWMELFSAETDVFQAQLDLSQALWDYNLKKARLLRLAGQGEPLAVPPQFEEWLR